ncbi:ribosome biogenesis protein Nop16 [Roridomyces roridus]|uniref:Nucleolar protein 16 n=1 Tax=Roridomyces roridus TaxID=1738132 RepID=A0AAD7BW15_9AGAR|nr:ribosome biogenesis protein Nop16 [Roridomyces roridus]
MANPRQRRKGRSGSHRPVGARHAQRNLRKMPPIRGPASTILSERWDKRKTVRQNYAALGLIHTLNPSASGGVEPEAETIIEEDTPMDLMAATPKGKGRIIRDAEGNVLRVEMVEEEAAGEETLHEPEMDSSILEKWVTGLGGGRKERSDGTVQELEIISSNKNLTGTTLSAVISGAGPRHASGGEVAYLERLVDKYGDDIERMARDRKLNPEQRTVGQLKRSLKRCGLGGS